jgi:hypothetical protein
MPDETVERIVASKKAVRLCAQRMRNSLEGKRPVDRGDLSEYIRNKFLLLQKDMAEGDIIKLAAISIERINAGAPGAENIRLYDLSDCTGAASSATKRVLLLMAVEKDLAIDLTAREAAGIKTIDDLKKAIDSK